MFKIDIRAIYTTAAVLTFLLFCLVAIKDYRHPPSPKRVHIVCIIEFPIPENMLFERLCNLVWELINVYIRFSGRQKK